MSDSSDINNNIPVEPKLSARKPEPRKRVAKSASASPNPPTSAIITALDSLTKTVRELTITIRSRVEEFARILFNLRVMGVAMLVMMVLLSANAIYGRYVSAQIQSATQPGGKIYERNQQATIAILKGIAIEFDCRNRRAIANLPAPDFGTDPAHPHSCLDQTPPEVYPGR